MKERLKAAGVATPPFVRLTGADADLQRLVEEVGFPALVKPEVSAASVGISLRSLVLDAEAAAAQFARLTQGEGGARFLASGIIAERFVDGPEYTALVAAGRVYPVVERVFHSALAPLERFLSFDRYWSNYQEESRLPEGEPFYRYALTPSPRQEVLAVVAQRAFSALSGTGYARVDIRVERRTDQPYVLEVNANCGLSGDTETSVGQILRLTGASMPSLLREILEDGLVRATGSR
jgi:D-alanine-D-alanine ligase